MKPRLPNLYVRILLWLMVNVVVIAIAFTVVVQWQFREGLHGVLGGLVGDRLQAIGQQMYESLNERPRAQWNAVLNDLSRQHGVQVTLRTGPETIIAGEAMDFPEKVKVQISEMSPNRRPDSVPEPPPPAAEPPPDPVADFLFGDALPERRPPPPMENGEGPERPGRMPSRLGTFLIQAGDPQHYYAGVRLPPPIGWTRRDGPLMLVIITDSMTAGGLFFDSQPWLMGIFGAMALSAVLWFPFVRRITGSIRQSMRATEEIAKGRFEVRVPENRSDELGRLAHAINQMAVQLDGLVRGQKRFLGDVAHELCSPIARMEMSLAILEPRLAGGDACRLTDVRDELRQISALVDELLSFSKAALGQNHKVLEPVSLLPLTEGVVQLEAVPADQCRIQVPSDLRVLGLPDMLRRAIGNVLRNARLHAAGSPVEITATKSRDKVVLQLADEGPGVPEESLPRLFEPFYRVDVARARETGGTGLGLAIVKTCIEACGGSVTAGARKPHGLIVSIELPCA